MQIKKIITILFGQILKKLTNKCLLINTHIRSIIVTDEPMIKLLLRKLKEQKRLKEFQSNLI